MSEPALEPDAGPVDRSVTPARMRRALGRFASGVTVVTTADSTGSGAVHGMTANAFTSVSLEPPLVLVSIANRARTRELITRSGRYGVSVLASHQEPLSLHFAGLPQEPDPVRFVWHDGVPLLDGALVRLACTVDAVHPAGDHTLFVGRVDELDYRYGQPLVFYTGSFRWLETTAVPDPWGF